jgi:hypothetical protein
VEELEDKLVVAELGQGRDVGVAERGVRSAHDRAEVVARELVRGDVERENGDGEIDEGVGRPLVSPVGGQRGDVLGDVEAAVGSEAREDGLERAGRGGQREKAWLNKWVRVTCSKLSSSAPPRVEKYFIEYRYSVENLFDFTNSAMRTCLHDNQLSPE